MKRTRCPNCDELMKKEEKSPNAYLACTNCSFRMSPTPGRMGMDLRFGPGGKDVTNPIAVYWTANMSDRYLDAYVYKNVTGTLVLNMYGVEKLIDITGKTDQEIIDIANENIARYSALKAFI